MANRECLIIVLDMRDSANKNFKLQTQKCIADIVKEKISTGKQDYISFVLLGTEETENEVNEESSNLCYNISQYPQIQLPSWKLLVNFYKFITAPSSRKGCWLDAIAVALCMLKKAEACFKCKHLRIALFQDFSSVAHEENYEIFDEITNKLLADEIELIVVSSDIAYVDNPEDPTKAQVVFKHATNFSQCANGLKNEKYALRLISHCNAELCNFNEALQVISTRKITRPWSWNCTLSIGTQLQIAVSGVIAIKNESNIKIKRCWAEKDEEVKRVKKYFVKGEEIHPEPEELTTGYMLGGTPVVYEKELDAEEATAGLKFIAFAKKDSVPNEYFTGDSQYWIVHQRSMMASAKKLEALVKAMTNTGMLMLCWKVFSKKFNKLRLVVLLPNELKEGEPASLSMVELSYHCQHHYWDFPKLCTKKTECTEEQMAAVNKLIDSMDLNINDKLGEEPRATKAKDLLPLHKFPNIAERNVMDILERKIIHNAGEDDEQFQKMLMDKNFVDIYWKVPEELEEEAKRAAKQVKALFPLQRTMPTLKARVGTNLTKKLKESTANLSQTPKVEKTLEFDAVSKADPATEFEDIVNYVVASIRNTTERDVKFNFYAKQLTSIVNELVFADKPPLDVEKITRAIAVYRYHAHLYATYEEYNAWIREVKRKILQRNELHLKEFFSDVIVAHKLGLCDFETFDLLEEQMLHEQFYKLE